MSSAIRVKVATATPRRDADPLAVLKEASAKCALHFVMREVKGLQGVTAKAEARRSFITTTVREQRPRSHHKGTTGRVRTGDQRYPVLCRCQLGQDIPKDGRVRLPFACSLDHNEPPVDSCEKPVGQLGCVGVSAKALQSR